MKTTRHSRIRTVILAGGQGTRLRPLTAVFPKPLVPLGNKPVVEILLRRLAASGLRDVTMCTGYLAELIKAVCGDGSRFGLRVEYVGEEKPLGTAGPLSLIPNLSDPFIVMNGDLLTTLDFQSMLEFHREQKADVTVGVFRREVKIDFGVLNFGDDPHILTGYQEKPEYSVLVSMGVYILDPLAWDFLTPGRPLPMPDLLESMRRRGHDIHCYRQECYWLDIGRHDDYATANEIFDARRGAFLGTPQVTKRKIGRDQ